MSSFEYFDMLFKMREYTKNYFKSNLLFLLKKNKIVPAQFSRAIGISKQAVSSWLKEDSNISMVHSIQVADFFSITLDTLFLYDLQSAHTLNNISEIEIFSNSDIAFASVDFQGIGNYCNPAMADLLQYNRGELISRHSYELVHPFDMQRYRTEMRKLKSGEANSVVLELKYLVGSAQFAWIKQIIINSPRDNRIYIFAFPLTDKHHPIVKLKAEKFFVATIALQELERCITQTFFKKDLAIIDNFDHDHWLDVDQSVFQCLIRGLFYQFIFIEIESGPRVIKLISKMDKDEVCISALMNCKPHTKTMSLKRLQAVATMVNARVEETLAANIYSMNLIFSK